MLTLNPNHNWYQWCRPGHSHQATSFPALPGGPMYRSPEEVAGSKFRHHRQNDPRSHQLKCENSLWKYPPIGQWIPERSGEVWTSCKWHVQRGGERCPQFFTEEQGHAICSRGFPSFGKPEQWKETNRHILPDIPGNFTSTEGQTRIWEVRCWPLHPIPTPVFQMSKVWPQLQDMPGHCRCLPFVLRYRSQTRQLSKQGVLEMYKLQRSTFCYQ